jgi:hypothetical protein
VRARARHARVRALRRARRARRDAAALQLHQRARAAAAAAASLCKRRGTECNVSILPLKNEVRHMWARVAVPPQRGGRARKMADEERALDTSAPAASAFSAACEPWPLEPRAAAVTAPPARRERDGTRCIFAADGGGGER